MVEFFVMIACPVANDTCHVAVSLKNHDELFPCQDGDSNSRRPSAASYSSQLGSLSAAFPLRFR